MTLNNAIKPANNAKKPVKYDSGLRYGSYGFIEFKRDVEKLKKHYHLIQKIKRQRGFHKSLINSKNLA